MGAAVDRFRRAAAGLQGPGQISAELVGQPGGGCGQQARMWNPADGGPAAQRRLRRRNGLEPVLYRRTGGQGHVRATAGSTNSPRARTTQKDPDLCLTAERLQTSLLPALQIQR